MATGNPLLDLSTLVERPRITIDGVFCDLVSPDEMTIIDHQRLGVWTKRIDELLQKENLNSAEEENLKTTLNRAADFILRNVSTGIKDKLHDQHKLQVLEVFMMLPLRNRLRVVAALKEMQSQIGGNLSPSSNGSMAVSPTVG